MECGMIFDVCVSKLMLINCLVDELTPSIYVFGVEKNKNCKKRTKNSTKTNINEK